MSKILFIFVLSAALLGCNKTNQHGDGLIADKGLRGFLGVRSLDANYQLPAGDTAYLVTLLEFEDGKLARRGMSSLGKIDQSGSRILNAQFLWGIHEGKPRVSLVTPGTCGRSESDFWRKLDGGWGGCDTNSQRVQHDGFVILGFAQSYLDNKGQTNEVNCGDFSLALTSKKYVGALAVKTFKSIEDANKEIQ